MAVLHKLLALNDNNQTHHSLKIIPVLAVDTSAQSLNQVQPVAKIDLISTTSTSNTCNIVTQDDTVNQSAVNIYRSTDNNPDSLENFSRIEP